MKWLLVLFLVAGASFTAGRIFDSVTKTAAADGGQGGGVEKCAAKNGDGTSSKSWWRKSTWHRTCSQHSGQILVALTRPWRRAEGLLPASSPRRSTRGEWPREPCQDCALLPGDTLRSAIDQLPFHHARQEGTIGAAEGELRGSHVLRVIFNTKGFTMTRLLTAGFCVILGFILGTTFHSSTPPVGAANEPVATQNGDTNGDGSIDISDAVHLLIFLFTGGASIAEIDCQSSASQYRLLATGRTDCFGEAAVIDCGVAKARGQDGFYQLGCPLEGRFVEHDDGTVTDVCTGLMWTKKAVDTDGDGELLLTDRRPWLGACQFAEDMTFADHSDWRVPNVIELTTILNLSGDSSLGNPFLLPFAFVASWTSTPNNGRPFALGALTPTSQFSCECCLIRSAPSQDNQFFVAVRSPVATP